MGREIKRVPLDFNYPMGQIWKGYFNPYHGVKCNTCEGTGSSPEVRKFKDDWYSYDESTTAEWIIYKDKYGRNQRYNNRAHQYHLTQIEVDALIAHKRIPLLTQKDHIPTVEEVNEWAKKDIMGHDAINEWICCEAFLKAQGIIELKCPVCDGFGEIFPTDEIAKKANEWWGKEKFDPPVGEGYQLWEITSEGSPCSPVFATLIELAEYCAKNCTVFGHTMWTVDQWLASFGGTPDMIAFHQGEITFV